MTTRSLLIMNAARRRVKFCPTISSSAMHPSTAAATFSISAARSSAATAVVSLSPFVNQRRTNFDFVNKSSSTTSRKNKNVHASLLPLTKIVATIGPTSEQQEPLRKVVEAGMTVMRLNFSHATRDEVELRMRNFHHAQSVLSSKNNKSSTPQFCKAVLLDTKGPEIRSGTLANDHSGHETVTLLQGDRITLHTDPKIRDQGSTSTDLYIDYPGLHKCLTKGSRVLLDDGAVELMVERDPDPTALYGEVNCVAQYTGSFRSRAGVNLPLADTSDLPALSDKDKIDIKYGLSIDIDYVAASFVQTGQGVRDIRKHILDSAADLGHLVDPSSLPLIISKIETASALENFDDILAESDGIMVARGDLGVEIPLSQVTCVQKQIVAACNAVGKPVIVATQMVESMTKSPRPTRAEVSDVTNSVIEGADAVMTSGETAKGKYPDGTVAFMNDIIVNTEAYVKSGNFRTFHEFEFSNNPVTQSLSAIVRAAVAASFEHNCQAILVLNNTESLAPLVAALRPRVPVLAFCENAKRGRRLQLHRAVYPIVSNISSAPYYEMAKWAMEEAMNINLISKGHPVVIISSERDDHATANLKICTV